MSNLTERTLDLAISIQQIPAPTFHEKERADFVRKRFEAEGLADVSSDADGNTYARLPGPSGRKQPGLIVCAHLDTVFPFSIDLKYEREATKVLGAGIGDNSLGVAGLFGLAWALKEQGISLPGDLWLAANVCEEGLGDLRGIKAVVERFEGNVRAYLILEGMALGQVYHRGLGVRRYRISVHTAGGHSWIDYGSPSAVHELTGISTRLAALELSRSPRTTLNVGIISGGSSVNTIAAEAMLELDLRSEGAEALEKLSRQVMEIVGEAEKPGITITVELIGQRPTGEIPAEHRLVKLAQSCLRAEGVEPRLNIGSTDANCPLSLGYPAVTIGLTTGARAHTVHEFINTGPLEKGMHQLVRLVSRAWEE